MIFGEDSRDTEKPLGHVEIPLGGRSVGCGDGRRIEPDHRPIWLYQMRSFDIALQARAG